VSAELRVNGADLLADLSGALFWPERQTLVVADLHLEKGSSFATQGRLLPPYDSAATLRRLGEVLQRLRPSRVICLGDSFHDVGAAERLSAADQVSLTRMTGAHDWIWIRGNHDPAPPQDWGGSVETEVTLGALVFRHEAETNGSGAGEVSGHYHPKAAVKVRARRLSGRCFVTDGRRLVLPAFGAYAGGLSVLDPAISGLFRRGFGVHLLGRNSVFRFPATALVA